MSLLLKPLSGHSVVISFDEITTFESLNNKAAEYFPHLTGCKLLFKLNGVEDDILLDRSSFQLWRSQSNSSSLAVVKINGHGELPAPPLCGPSSSSSPLPSSLTPSVSSSTLREDSRPSASEIQNAMALSCASYEPNPLTYLATNMVLHNFTKFVVSDDLENVDVQKTLVGITSDHEVFICFRGTVDIEDIKQDLKIIPYKIGSGAVHAGFFERADQFPVSWVLRWLNSGFKVRICGHSLGGAVAQLYTFRILLDNELVIQASQNDTDLPLHQKLRAITFAAPFWADPSIRKAALQFRWKSCFFNFVNQNDCVPGILHLSNLLLQNKPAIAGVTNFSLGLLKVLSDFFVGKVASEAIQVAFNGLMQSTIWDQVYKKMISDPLYVPVGYFGLISSRDSSSGGFSIFVSKSAKVLNNRLNSRISDSSLANHRLVNYKSNLPHCFDDTAESKPFSCTFPIRAEIGCLNLGPQIQEVLVDDLANQGFSIEIKGSNLEPVMIGGSKSIKFKNFQIGQDIHLQYTHDCLTISGNYDQDCFSIPGGTSLTVRTPYGSASHPIHVSERAAVNIQKAIFGEHRLHNFTIAMMRGVIQCCFSENPSAAFEENHLLQCLCFICESLQISTNLRSELKQFVSQFNENTLGAGNALLDFFTQMEEPLKAIKKAFEEDVIIRYPSSMKKILGVTLLGMAGTGFLVLTCGAGLVGLGLLPAVTAGPLAGLIGTQAAIVAGAPGTVVAAAGLVYAKWTSSPESKKYCDGLKIYSKFLGIDTSELESHPYELEEPIFQLISKKFPLENENMIPHPKVLAPILSTMIATDGISLISNLSLAQADRDSQEETNRRLSAIYYMHKLRYILASFVSIGLLGPQNAGKSTLVQYFFPHESSIIRGAMSRTVSIQRFEASPHLSVLDFPGTTDNGATAQKFASVAYICNVIILLLDARKLDAGAMSAIQSGYETVGPYLQIYLTCVDMLLPEPNDHFLQLKQTLVNRIRETLFINFPVDHIHVVSMANFGEMGKHSPSYARVLQQDYHVLLPKDLLIHLGKTIEQQPAFPLTRRDDLRNLIQHGIDAITDPYAALPPQLPDPTIYHPRSIFPTSSSSIQTSSSTDWPDQHTSFFVLKKYLSENILPLLRPNHYEYSGAVRHNSVRANQPLHLLIKNGLLFIWFKNDIFDPQDLPLPNIAYLLSHTKLELQSPKGSQYRFVLTAETSEIQYKIPRIVFLFADHQDGTRCFMLFDSLKSQK